jgi:hypothetical protein
MTSSELAGLAKRLQSALEAAFASDESASEQSAANHDDAENHTARERGETPLPDTGSQTQPRVEHDHRLYLPFSDDWQVRVHKGIRTYCSFQNPGENWFHLLVDGELYLHSGEEKICLNCALRHGLLTTDRLYWQKGWGKPSSRQFPKTATE